jgi:Ca2+-binding RTX toxin-like protein
MALTASEQYLLELMNRARLDPIGEAQRYGLTDLNQGLPAGTISAQPLPVFAYDTQLEAAAEAHSQWMIDTDTFSHTGAGGSSSRQRMTNAGYEFTGSGHSGENIALYGTTGSLDPTGAIDQEHKDLFLSSGHRANLLTADFSKAGIGQVIGKYSQNGSTFNASLLTQDFGSSSGVFVTGVIYNDSNGNAFYTPGEGVGGTAIQVAGGAGAGSAPAGGYTVAAPRGQVQVQIGNASVLVSTLAGNAKLDLVGGSLLKASADVTLLSGINRVTLLGAGNINATGSAGDDTLTGNAGANRLEGGGGFDVLIGGAGDDGYVNPAGDDVVEGPGGGNDTIFSDATFALGSVANVENLTLTGRADADATGDAGANVITGNSGANTITGGAGNDTLDGGAGTDTVSYATEQGPVTVDLSAAGPQATGAAGTDTLSNFENVTGGAGADALKGNAGNNVLDGGGGADTLDGGGGSDTLIGGSGDDLYLVSGAVKIVEAAGGGYDKVLASASIVLDPNVEDVALTGGANIDATGNDLDNRLTGNSGNNVLSGGPGRDTLAGGLGDDTYVDPDGDVLVEDADGGTDTVLSRNSVSLANFANIENVALTGDANVNAAGNGGANRITGNAGSNMLDGGGGADTMTGGLGNDTYRVDQADDIVTELAGQGNDTILSSVSYALTAGQPIEALAAAEATLATALNLSGNELAQALTGNAGANILDGRGGADTMAGLGGNDVYRVDSAGDRIIEAKGQGDDLVLAGVTFALGLGQYVERLEAADPSGTAAIDLTGNETAQFIVGNAGANRLDGRAGADTLSGLGGNDVYFVDAAGDVVVEAANAGTDTVLASASYALGARQSIEVLATASAAGLDAINLSGNEFAQTITGNAGANILRGGGGDDTLDGGPGADVLAGDSGNDTYLNPEAADRISELVDGGIDTVLSNATFSLAGAANVERLVLTGSGVIDGTGNGLANEIVGNGKANVLAGNAGNDTLRGGDGADRLIGGAGTDYLAGGAGNDTYVDPAGDRVIELAGEGTDTIESSVSFNLGPVANVERLVLTGTANIGGSGNAMANLIQGNAGANTLNGGDGADTLEGGAGNDRLAGGPGIDSLVGGAGDDVYVNPTGDRIVELAGGGTADGVESDVTFSLAALPEIEWLRLTGGAAVDGSGNDGDNRITGNSGNNVLSGGLGNDTLLGGAGDDRFAGGGGADEMRGGAGDDTYVDPSFAEGDRIIEEAGATGGNDLVLSRYSVSIAAAANVERLTLTGSGHIAGTGNGGANTITGNGGNNSLDGGAGNDTLLGGAGRDTLTGGRGNDLLDGGSEPDLFRFEASGAGDDVIAGFDAARDRFELGRGLFTQAQEGGGDTLLTYSGGTILVQRVSGLSLEQWNALVVAPAAPAAASAQDAFGAALDTALDKDFDAHHFAPSADEGLAAAPPADLILMSQTEFLAP